MEKVCKGRNNFLTSNQIKQKFKNKGIYQKCLTKTTELDWKTTKLSKFQRLKTESNGELRKKKKCIHYDERPSLALKSTTDDFDIEEEYLSNKYREDYKAEK